MNAKKTNYGRSISKSAGRTNSSKRKGTKPNNVSKSKFTKYEMANEGTDPRNDISWYTANPELLRDAASFPYARVLGLPFKIADKSDANATGNTKGYTTIPGIMVFDAAAVPGHSKDGSSAINMAARSLYSFVRHQNSGSKNYESADLFMYVLALDSAYTYWAELVRVYGVMNKFKAMNRYLPVHLVTAMGYDYDDLQGQMADFRYYINQYAYKLGSLAVPSGFDLFKRHLWLFGNYFVDSDSDKAQTFVFHNVGSYTFSGRTNERGSELIYTTKGDTPQGLADIITWGNSLLTPLIEDEDIGIMSGDILKAFGRENLLTLSTVAPDFIVDPIYSIEVLSQIQNASFGPIIDDYTSFNVTQSSGQILCEPTASVSGGIIPFSRIINMYTDNVNPGDTMVATRLTAMWEMGDNVVKFTTFGTEIIVSAHIIKLGVNDSGEVDSVKDTYFISDLYYDQYEYFDVSNMLRGLTDLSNFRFHPIIYNYLLNESDSTQRFIGFLGDLNNYTVLDSADLEVMNEAALLSLVDCKNMGSWSRKFN